MENNEVMEDKGLLGDYDPSELSVQPEHPGDAIVLQRGPDGQPKQTFERPSDLPQEFWDDENGSYRSEEILKAYKAEQQKALGLRQKLSKGVQNVPQDVNAYQVDGEDLEVGDENELNAFREIAFNNKLSQEQFNGLIRDLQKYSADLQGGEDPEDRQQYVENVYQQEMSKLGEDAPQIISNLRSWGRSLVQQGVMSDDDYKAFLDMPVTAEHVRILNTLRHASGYITDIPVNSSGLISGTSKEEIDKILASPEYDRGDPVLIKKVNDYFEQMYGK